MRNFIKYFRRWLGVSTKPKTTGSTGLGFVIERDFDGLKFWGESARRYPNANIRVVDYDRDVWIQYITMERNIDEWIEKKIMVLVWHEKVIPFELDGLYQSKFPGGKKEAGWRIVKFGESVMAWAVGLCGPYKFQSEKERKQASLLAVEALFTYGLAGNGDKPNLAGMLVAFNGGIYDRYDFGTDREAADK